MQNQHQVNGRRRRRNLPAELKVEIVDCLPLENAVHFLANVPTRLIIHHCAPRVRRMLKMIDQIVVGYARALSAANFGGELVVNFGGEIDLMDGHKYTPEMDIFLRYGAAHCCVFLIWRGAIDGFVDYPVHFFDDLIKYYYETKVPEKGVEHVAFELSCENPAPWPAALVRPQQAGQEMNVEELKVDHKWKRADFIMRNKHNPGIAFKLVISFDKGAKCYQQMTDFYMRRMENVH